MNISDDGSEDTGALLGNNVLDLIDDLVNLTCTDAHVEVQLARVLAAGGYSVTGSGPVVGAYRERTPRARRRIRR